MIVLLWDNFIDEFIVYFLRDIISISMSILLNFINIFDTII
jgi:hypothetical protein